MDITPLLSYLKSTSNLALSCKGFAWRVSSNGFPIKSSKRDLCLENLSFYKLLEYPEIDQWTINEFYDAIKTDNCDHLKLLLRGGANIDAKNKDGWTVLLLAAEFGKVECLKLLLERGANIEAKNENGSTALINAISLADCAGDVECLELLLEHKVNIEATDNVGYSALRWAAIYGQVKCMQLLLASGAKVEPWLREYYPEYSELWQDSTL